MNLRQKRIARGVNQILSRLLYEEIRDPELVGVEITSVHMTADLQIAKVYWKKVISPSNYENSVASEADSVALSGAEQVQNRLMRCSGFFRAQLSQHLQLRRTPQLRFYFDQSLERGQRIERLISEALADKNPSLPNATSTTNSSEQVAGDGA